jgi:hypothetical protein
MLGALNPRYMGLANSVSFSENALPVMACPNFSDISVRKSAIPMVKSVIVPSLVRGVSVVFRLCPNAEMVRIYARRIIANVHDYFSIWDGADKELIGITVRTNLTFIWHQKNAIPGVVFCASPKPTSICFFNAIFKNILRAKNAVCRQVSVISGAVVTRSAKPSGNACRFPAIDAKKFSPNLVCHEILRKWKLIICYNHGVC